MGYELSPPTARKLLAKLGEGRSPNRGGVRGGGTDRYDTHVRVTGDRYGQPDSDSDSDGEDTPCCGGPGQPLDGEPDFTVTIPDGDYAGTYTATYDGGLGYWQSAGDPHVRITTSVLGGYCSYAVTLYDGETQMTQTYQPGGLDCADAFPFDLDGGTYGASGLVVVSVVGWSGGDSDSDSGSEPDLFGFYPCVITSYNPVSDEWVEYGPALALASNGGTLSRRRYRAIHYGDYEEYMVFAVDECCGTNDNDSDSGDGDPITDVTLSRDGCAIVLSVVRPSGTTTTSLDAADLCQCCEEPDSDDSIGLPGCPQYGPLPSDLCIAIVDATNGNEYSIAETTYGPLPAIPCSGFGVDGGWVGTTTVTPSVGSPYTATVVMTRYDCNPAGCGLQVYIVYEGGGTHFTSIYGWPFVTEELPYTEHSNWYAPGMGTVFTADVWVYEGPCVPPPDDSDS